MLSADAWQEIWETVHKNKLRTFLTGLAVAWGIFMLVVLMGASTGLENGVTSQFKDDAVNSIWVFGGWTSQPHGGRGPGRRIQLRNGDHEAVARGVQEVEFISSRFGGWGEQVTVRYRDRVSNFDVRSVHPDHELIEKTIMMRGRFLHDGDLAEHRKVVVIGKAVDDFLFRGEDAIGREVAINGVSFQVIGVYQDLGGEDEDRVVYIPITTAQRAFNGADKINTVMFTIGEATVDDSKRIEAEVRQMMAERHGFAVDDQRALRVRNNLEQYRKVADIFVGFRWVIWIVSIGTIIAGIVGVSNIMLIAVKERTKEFGIRKAIGATPGSIIAMVVKEAVVLTSVAGYLGLLAGVAVVELIARLVPANDMFLEPEIDFSTAILAAALLVGAGALAGFFPAWRAARVNPVVALRDE
jgi:putative ABC transport system permease protein